MLIAAFVFGAAFVVYEYWTLPDVSTVATKNPQVTALMELRSREAAEAGKKARRVQRWVNLSDLPPYLVSAVIISEDASFYVHDGVDLREMRNAAVEAARDGKLGRGASTITQQVAKNLWLSTERSILRKGKEILLATRMEDALSKKRILTLYLNVIEWGDGVYGVDAGAREHFGVSAANVTPGQAVMLASMLPAPRKWTPENKSQSLRTRSLRLIDKLAAVGKLSADQAAGAKAEVEATIPKRGEDDDGE